jgi:hypothetical protein
METFRRYFWAVILSVAVLISWNGAPSIAGADDGPPAAGTSLALPPLYVATSPLSRVLDTLTLLSVPQTVAFLVGAAVIALAVIGASRTRDQGPLWKRLVIAFTIVLVIVAALEAAVAFLPRPMARLDVRDRDIVRVDFHSHTNASRDANQRFSAEDRREWHRDGGFDIGYISDHVRFGGAAEAAVANPQRAGDGTSELSAVEGRYHRIISTIMLGLTTADTAILDSKGHLESSTAINGKQVVTIVTLPNRHLDSVTAESMDSVPHFAGIELVDAAPRGLGQLDRDEAKVRRIAETNRLLLVAASNNHGYGRAVAAWNLMRIPGWRAMSPDSVGALIEQAFRERRTDAVTIVKRVRPRTQGAALPLTLPVGLWQILGGLTPGERLVWLLWIWAIATLVKLRRPRRTASAPNLSTA